MAEEDHAGTPLWERLGITEGSSVTLVGAPRGFPSLLRPLPDGARIGRAPADVIVMFTRRRPELRHRLPRLAAKLTPGGGLLVAWPRQAAPVETDLSFDRVRRAGLDAGLVDDESCSIDADWQALRFVRRRST